ncbi:cobalamin biosynthesis protein CbiX [Streptomyces sp. NPDC014734]|uniref:cobalamin biosynthesis protein CbiX n=1 Tax=Streptomyces sp. NPDC014734 TaxID=3364886 RepID=UPI0036F792BC
MSDASRVIAVCGHEAANGAALRGAVAPAVTVVTRGRELYRRVVAARRAGERCCVVPMTLGREPGLVADAARTLRALPAAERAGTLLAEPFGTPQHLIAWLRAAAVRVPATAALLVTAPSGDPFEDAELYRVASLVRRYGSHPVVEVAFGRGDPDPVEGVRRCRLLGASHVVLLPAAFALPDLPGVPDAGVECAGPPVSPAALARILAERVADAERRWAEHGDDGIDSGLSAADDHGHAHSHAVGEGHSHAHPPGAGHTHSHPRPQGDGHDHDHGRGHGHPHAHHHPHARGAGRVTRSNS